MAEPPETHTDPFTAWLHTGLTAGYCGPPICAPHDGIPTSHAEDDAYDDGADPCIHIIRLYPDPQTKTAIEDNHPPSSWRKP